MGMKIEKSWHEKLKDEIEKPYIQKLKKFLLSEQAAGKIVYPPENLVFNAFSQTPFEKVKIVIVGQDPYHGPGQAHGLCFSVPDGVAIPPSLRNIFLELEKDLNIPPSETGNLIGWAKQGVLLLNAALTVRKDEAGSHAGQGWEQFTDAVIAKLLEKKEPIVFLLWGRLAQEKCKNIINQNKGPHSILTAAHPSPLSAHRGFLGCRHFSTANQILVKNGETPIDWSLLK